MNVTSKYTRIKLFFDFCYSSTCSDITIPLIISIRKYARQITCTFNWIHRVEWLFFPLSQDTLFSYSDSISATQRLCIRTHPSIRYNEEQRSRKNSTHSIDTFTHQEKYQALCFYMVDSNPAPSSLPNLAFSAYFQRRSRSLHRIPLCTQRQIYDTARDVDVQTSPRLLPVVVVVVVSTEVRNNVSLAGVWNRE